MAWTRKSILPHCLSTLANTASSVAVVGHVALADDMRAEFGGQRLDALLEGFALIGKRDLGALVGAGLGDAPGDRAIVGDAHDEAALAGHQALSSCHAFSPNALGIREPYRTAILAHQAARIRMASAGARASTLPARRPARQHHAHMDVKVGMAAGLHRQAPALQPQHLVRTRPCRHLDGELAGRRLDRQLCRPAPHRATRPADRHAGRGPRCGSADACAA